jgi:glyceraldehyde-3-phosphate dehydrogenase (NADP+)
LPANSRQGRIRWFPAGPVAAITPFNFPLNLVAHKLAPAIAVGCPVVLKPAPQTPLTALKLAEFITDAGLPPGALSVLPMENDVAAKLVADDRLKILSFTGSAKVGWELKAKAGKKKVVLELGGNAAVIVESDADVEHAAQRCVAGGFGYSGQSCISVQRIFVQQAALSVFCDRMVAGVKNLRSGDPLYPETDCGPLIRESDAIRVEAWINEAVARGARLLTGGKRNGWFVEPTVLTGTKPGDKVNAEEVFGPVVVVEPYEALDDAIAQVNASRYGLQAGIFSADPESIDRAFTHIEVGGVIANDVPTFRGDAMPYGGVKDSGMGREGVLYALQEFSEMRILVT